MAKAPTATQADMIRAAVALAARPSVDHLLYVGDLPLPEELFRGKPRARKRLVQAVVERQPARRDRGLGRPGACRCPTTTSTVPRS